MKSLLNRKACKEFALECAKGRFHKFTRVSKRFLVSIEAIVKGTITFKVENHPSVGKTLMALILCLGLYSCQPAFAATASWYDSNSVQKEGTCHEEKCYTASGKEIHQLEREGVLFAASNDFKIGTRVRVTNPASGKSTVVKILDRGGFTKKYGRGIDLCRKAFSVLENPRRGLLQVTVEKI